MRTSMSHMVVDIERHSTQFIINGSWLEMDAVNVFPDELWLEKTGHVLGRGVGRSRLRDSLLHGVEHW